MRFHCAAVGTDDGLAHREAKAHIPLPVPGRGLRAVQCAVKQAVQLLRRDAAAVVLHGEAGPLPVPPGRKPANKKSSPKQDLSEEKFTGSR